MARDGEAAELMAIRALGYLADDPDRLARFVALSGMVPQDLRAQAADPAFLGGVLDFVLGDEATLVAFADAAQVKPEAVMRARYALPGAPPPEW
ncbi:MAG: DUF3572 domain-containing protein [Alphaproteobacteria bacterium]